MILPILTDDNPILRDISMPVTEFDQSLADLARNLLDTCSSEKALGIAAPQVGVLKQVIVVSADAKNYIVMVNPKITYKGLLKTQHYESCLSFPDRRFLVERPISVTVEYQDISGESHTLDAKNWLSYAIVHEEHHCKGVLLPDIATKEARP